MKTSLPPSCFYADTNDSPPRRLGYCGGVHLPARVAFFGLGADGAEDPALHFEAVAEFESFTAAATVIGAAEAAIEAFWRSGR